MFYISKPVLFVKAGRYYVNPMENLGGEGATSTMRICMQLIQDQAHSEKNKRTRHKYTCTSLQMNVKRSQIHTCSNSI